jgi:hypothetical protein
METIKTNSPLIKDTGVFSFYNWYKDGDLLDPNEDILEDNESYEIIYNKENITCDKLPCLPIQFIDFSYVQNKMFEEEFMNEGYEYWITNLQNIDPYIYYIPTDRDTILRSFFVKHHWFTVNFNVIEKLRKECKTTTCNVMKSIFAILLSKLNQIDTIVLGEINENRYIQKRSSI